MLFIDRDICKTDAVNYSQDLIPIMSSLLQSVTLHPISLCLIIDSLNACVEANAIDIHEGNYCYFYRFMITL